jgi:hypothetical protein
MGRGFAVCAGLDDGTPGAGVLGDEALGDDVLGWTGSARAGGELQAAAVAAVSASAASPVS